MCKFVFSEFFSLGNSVVNILMQLGLQAFGNTCGEQDYFSCQYKVFSNIFNHTWYLNGQKFNKCKAQCNAVWINQTAQKFSKIVDNEMTPLVHVYSCSKAVYNFSGVYNKSWFFFRSIWIYWFPLVEYILKLFDASLS